jgi:type IV secretion system protein VirB10
MKLAMRLPEKSRPVADDSDPREEVSAEVIDLATRTAYPVVSQRKGRSDALGLAAGVGIVALLGAATLWGLNASRTEQMPPAAALPEAQPIAPAGGGLAALPTPEQEAMMAAAGSPGLADPALSPVLSAPPGIAPIPTGNPYASATVVFDTGARTTAPVSTSPVAEGSDSAPQKAPGEDFASRIGGIGGGPATATSTFDPATTVTQGTMIPAVLETAINTDVPGYVRAVVSQDVRSYNGQRVLVPRSSRLVGQYQSGLQAGQKRAYVIWTRLIRPDGVSVNLASPATGFDGSTGLEGDVDSHFFKRFGSAMLLSVIGGLSAAVSGGASVVLGGGNNPAATALQQNGQISPTVRVRMGEPIRVFTARDLDFSRAPRL